MKNSLAESRRLSGATRMPPNPVQAFQKTEQRWLAAICLDGPANDLRDEDGDDDLERNR